MALVAQWKLQDNAASTTVVATVGSNGTLTGAGNTSASTTTGPGTALARAISLDGTNDWIPATTGNTGCLQNTSAATICCWVKANGISGTRNMVFVSNPAGGARFALRFNGTGTIAVVARAGDAETSQVVTTTAEYDDNAWHHVAAVIDYAADSIKIFVDGSQVSTTGTPAFTATATSNTASNVVIVGAANGSEFTFGALADVRIYNSDESANIATIVADANEPGVISLSSKTTTSVTLSWTTPTGVGDVTEQLEVSRTGAGSWSDVTGATASPATATGLDSNATYDFRVAYTDDNGTTYSNTVSDTTNYAIGYSIPAGMSVINDARLNNNSRTFSGNKMHQHALKATVSATGLRLLFVNRTASPIVFEASCSKGFRSSINLPQRVTFGGSNECYIPANTSKLSDALHVTSISAGEFLYCRVYGVGQTFSCGLSAPIDYNPESNLSVPLNTNGTRSICGVATVASSASLTLAVDAFEEAFTTSDTSGVFSPYAIIGTPAGGSRELVTILGDSKTVSSSPPDSNTTGIIYKAFGSTGQPYQNISEAGATAGSLFDGSSNALSQVKGLLSMPGGNGKAPILIYRLGINSILDGPTGGVATTQELASLQNAIAACPASTKVICATVDPASTKDGGASWSTITEGQQQQIGNSIDCINDFNDELRNSQPAYIDRVADTASEVSTSAGWWLPTFTNDGVHQTEAANTLQAPHLLDAVEELADTGGSNYTTPVQGPFFSPGFSPLNPIISIAGG